MITLTAKTLLFAILSVGTPVAHAATPPVASPEVSKKSVTIRYSGDILTLERRKELASLLEFNHEIAETKYEASDAEDSNVEVVEVSEGVDRDAVAEMVDWFVFEYDPCPD